MTVDQLRIGQKGKIKQFYQEKIALLMNELGIFQGEMIEVTSRSPLGDPICVKTPELFLSIRQCDAQYIEIEL